MRGCNGARAMKARTLSPSAVLALVAGVLFWTAYASFTRYNLDAYGDMLENYAWGIGWQWGYSKHPPLFGWITAAWFSILPRADWAYYLLSATNSGLAILVILLVARDFMGRAHQHVLVIVAWFLPAFGFLAIKYNANAAMLPFWALCLLFYLRMLERRRMADAVLLGVCGGLAMLAKYHSAVMILTFALFTVLDRQARPLLRTPLPWVTTVVALLVFAPHVLWLIDHDFAPIVYAASQDHGGTGAVALKLLEFTGAVIGYALPGLLLLAALRRWRDGNGVFHFGILPGLARSGAGRAVLAMAAGPLILTLVIAFAMGTLVSSPWSIPFFVPLPLVLVAMLDEETAEAGRVKAAIAAAVAGAALLISSPFIYESQLSRNKLHTADPLRAVAAAVETRYRDLHDAPLRIAGGDRILAFGTAFYARGDVLAAVDGNREDFHWVTPEMIARDGGAFLCAAARETCVARAERFLGRIDASEAMTFDLPAEAGVKEPLQVQVFYRAPETR